jgi:hypothetical protein
MLDLKEDKIQKDTWIRKTRRIPVNGEVFVKVGDSVTPETVVARGIVINPEIHKVIAYGQLDIDPSDLEKYMLKDEGDEVKRDEVIAIHRSFFGRSTKVCRSPVDGTIEAVSGSSGSVLIRDKPIPVEVKAHIPGKVAETITGEGAVIECRGTLIQGIFGIDGETVGELATPVNKSTDELASELISDEHKGKIIVAGASATVDALRKAVSTGVNGIIVGGVDQRELTDFLGYEIGLGITGKEKVGLTLIITERFGTHPMDERIFDMLKSCEGKRASIDGSTQIRTRILRPEIIIPA